MKDYNQLRLLFEKNGGIMTTRSLRDSGVSQYYIRKMVKDGQIESLKRGTYRLTDTDLNEFLEAASIVSKGIFCLHSAASLHELSTFIPSEYHLAIPKKNKVTLPEYPPIQLYYWGASQYTLGIEEISQNGHSFYAYDREKTVCDFLKLRNRVGFDLTKEVLKTYLRSNDRDINKLVKYSRQLRIHSIVDQYLKILL